MQQSQKAALPGQARRLATSENRASNISPYKFYPRIVKHAITYPPPCLVFTTEALLPRLIGKANLLHPHLYHKVHPYLYHKV